MNTDIAIRPAAAEDVAAILPLWRDLIESHVALDGRYKLAPDAATQTDAALRADLDRPDACCLVAVRGPAVAGYCRVSIRERSPIFQERIHGYISEMHVAAGFRRSGIGRGLFEETRRWLAERGVHRVELFALHANQASRAFWESVGCKVHGEHRFLEFPGV